jgi:hypothetical protein
VALGTACDAGEMMASMADLGMPGNRNTKRG